MFNMFNKYVEKHTSVISLAFITFFYANVCSAADISSLPNIADMLVKFSETMPELMRLTTAIAYVLGFFFVLKGVMALKTYGESRTQMSTQHELKEPLIYLFVGALLIYLPTSVQAGLSTFWSNPTPYAYIDEGGSEPWADLIKACYMIIQLIGTISFIRGLILLASTGGHGAQHGTFGKAMAHIIAGIFCINIYQLIQAVMNTLL